MNLENRKKGIGGSDASALLGINPWKNKLAVYLDKIDENIVQQESNFTHFGNVLEQVVADEFMRQTGKKVQRYNKQIQHPQFDFMVGYIDRKVVGENAFLECKTTSAYNSSVWKNEVPAYYVAQLQHYMAILNYEYCYIAVLVGGNQFKYYTVQRDDEYIERLIEVETDFWNNNVLKRQEPEIDGHEFTSEFLKLKYAKSNDNIIELDSAINVNVQIIQEYKQQIDTLKDEITKHENIIKNYLQDNEVAENNQYKITWKTQVTKRFNTTQFKKEHSNLYEQFVKESESRVFKIKEK